MPRETFQQQLQWLQDDVLALGSMVENAIIESVETLKQRDLEGARWLIGADRFINDKRFAIEKDVLGLMATQQPMAGDLRTLAAVLIISTELERIGDYAKGIAKISLMISEQPLVKPLVDIPLMAEKARDMLDRALNSFVRRDVELARAVPAEDDEVDALYNQVYRELLAMIMSNPRILDQATYLVWVAHNLERAADRVINICERVVFTVTGEMIEMDLEGREDSGVEGLA
ncbi:MAG: PhoU family transcriptional regulator [Anaerolineae bacterium SM23_84]|jgi:phosphate transport system protein|nr:MAG: PhoU family transcriptional regulator [Anaerolineae bacterium SM23_84]